MKYQIFDVETVLIYIAIKQELPIFVGMANKNNNQNRNSNGS